MCCNAIDRSRLYEACVLTRRAEQQDALGRAAKRARGEQLRPLQRELHRLAQFLDVTGLRPLIDSVIPMEHAADGLSKIVDGSLFGKIVLTR